MTSVDLAVLGVMALSGLLACMRGFVREVLSIGAWFGAVAIAAAGQSAGRDIARQWIPDQTIASAASFVAILLVSLIVLKIIARSIGSLIKASGSAASIAHSASFSASLGVRRSLSLPIWWRA